MEERDSFIVVCAVIRWNGAALRIDVGCRSSGYSFRFWDEKDKAGDHRRAQDVIRRMKYFNADFWEGGIFRKLFEYPSEEDALYQYMTAFNSRLTAVIAG